MDELEWSMPEIEIENMENVATGVHEGQMVIAIDTE